jgi:hypothetical protein
MARRKSSSKENDQPQLSDESTEPTVYRRNIGITELLAECQDHVTYAFGHRSDANERLGRALASTLELYHLGKANNENLDALKLQYEGAGIRVTKRTNDFTPLVKLVFKDTDDRSNINRYAGVLRLAVAKNVSPDNLPDFIKENGGIAKTAILEVQMRRDSGATVDQSDASPLDLRRAQAIPINLGDFRDIPAAGPFTLLIEPVEEGKYWILGALGETEKGVDRYLEKLAKRENAKARKLKSEDISPSGSAAPVVDDVAGQDTIASVGDTALLKN